MAGWMHKTQISYFKCQKHVLHLLSTCTLNTFPVFLMFLLLHNGHKSPALVQWIKSWCFMFFFFRVTTVLCCCWLCCAVVATVWRKTRLLTIVSQYWLSYDQLSAASLIGRNAVTWHSSLSNAERVTVDGSILQMLMSFNMLCITTVGPYL